MRFHFVRHQMSRVTPRPWLMAALVFLGTMDAREAHGQQRPTPAQAQQLLLSRPELAIQIRQWIGTSGLTPDQIRARLRAEGYPEQLLDAYMAGGTTEQADSLRVDDIVSAVRALGIADSLDIGTLRMLQRGDS